MTGLLGASKALEIGGHCLSLNISLDGDSIDEDSSLDGLTHFDEGIDDKTLLSLRLGFIWRSHYE